MGRVSGLFGVKGWVRVFSHTRPPAAILGYDRWFVRRDGDWKAIVLEEGRPHGKAIVARFANVADREQAAPLVGCDIAVPRAALPELRDGSYYWADLEGLRVVRRDGTELGRVAYLLETGANDVLVIQGEHERLIPFIADKVILDVDIANGVITVDWDWD
ncbi:MAG: ribosome maturation factor RimM [Woeseiaceae bacterium]